MGVVPAKGTINLTGITGFTPLLLVGETGQNVGSTSGAGQVYVYKKNWRDKTNHPNGTGLEMDNGNGSSKKVDSAQSEAGREPTRGQQDVRLHRSWLLFMRFCERLRHGEVERLKIQDKLPVLAEVATKKVKFA